MTTKKIEGKNRYGLYDSRSEKLIMTNFKKLLLLLKTIYW